MRGVSLSEIRRKLRAEIGQTLNLAASKQGDAALNVLISNKQQWLAAEYSWPFLELRRDVPIADRYGTFPLADGGVGMALDDSRPIKVEVLYNGEYQDVLYGIGSEEYNVWNSDLGQRVDPIQRWRYQSNETDAQPDQFEVWPIPITQQVVRFTGIRALLPLIADADVADLDDMLLVYGVAIDKLLAEPKPSEQAQAKAVELKERFTRILGALPSREGKIVLGKNLVEKRDYRRLVPVVVVR